MVRRHTGNTSDIQSALFDFILKEWLLFASAAGFVLTSIYTGHIPVYSAQEMQVLFILFGLFITVKGLEYSGLLLKITQSLEKGRLVPFKLVLATFFLSMLVTNDVALMVIVPLTLALNANRRDILVILEALAANAGSALMPFGNPQNFFLYWFYHLSPSQFIESMAPFSFTFLGILILWSLVMKIRCDMQHQTVTKGIEKSFYIYGVLLAIILLIILRVLPVSAGFLVLLYVFLFDRKCLRIDYTLLLSFFFFFGLAGNLRVLLASGINHSEHVFLFSALASQVMSNVPAALLFAKFTTHWNALLWGTNAGGFGSLFGSIANLIAYKLYITHATTKNTALFTAKFLAIGYGAFFSAISLYFYINSGFHQKW